MNSVNIVRNMEYSSTRSRRRLPVSFDGAME
jgi:hypothetical protein